MACQYNFSTAVVTNYCQFSGLKQDIFIYHSSSSHESKNQGVSPVIPPGGSRGDSMSLPFAAAKRGCFHFLVWGPFLLCCHLCFSHRIFDKMYISCLHLTRTLAITLGQCERTRVTFYHYRNHNRKSLLSYFSGVKISIFEWPLSSLTLGETFEVWTK